MAENTTTSFTESQSNIEFNHEAYDEGYEQLSEECKELLLLLPKRKGWVTPYVYLYQDIWYAPATIQGICSFQKHFQAKDSDIIIATLPKSGTTWLKALTFAIVNRKLFSPSQSKHPLLNSNAHELVPFLEFHLYANNQIPDLSIIPEPRVFGTHVPFHSLPDSITNSKCKIIYICRNPFDNFVSFWFHLNKITPPSLPKLSCEDAFKRYSKGINDMGPFWTNMLSYWRASKETPDKIMFLKYEDLQADIHFYLRRIAEFLDCPLNLEEESDGMIGKITDLCSFEKMKELDINKTGKFVQKYENKHLFRKGKVGDWVNHFSSWMEEELSKVIEDKLGGSGLSFEMLTSTR